MVIKQGQEEAVKDENALEVFPEEDKLWGKNKGNFFTSDNKKISLNMSEAGNQTEKSVDDKVALRNTRKIIDTQNQFIFCLPSLVISLMTKSLVMNLKVTMQV